MPMPRWFAHVNKQFFNRIELKRGIRPVLRHVGRSSGTLFRTPLEVFVVDGGYLFILIYGSGSDWVQNVLAAGSANLEIDGDVVELSSPRLVDEDEALNSLPPDAKLPPNFLNVDEFLRVDS